MLKRPNLCHQVPPLYLYNCIFVYLIFMETSNSDLLTDMTQEIFSSSSPTSPAQCLASIVGCNSTNSKEEGGVYCSSSNQILCCLDPETCQKEKISTKNLLSSSTQCLAQPTDRLGLDIKQMLPCKWALIIVQLAFNVELSSSSIWSWRPWRSPKTPGPLNVILIDISPQCAYIATTKCCTKLRELWKTMSHKSNIIQLNHNFPWSFGFYLCYTLYFGLTTASNNEMIWALLLQ